MSQQIAKVPSIKFYMAYNIIRAVSFAALKLVNVLEWIYVIMESCVLHPRSFSRNWSRGSEWINKLKFETLIDCTRLCFIC